MHSNSKQIILNRVSGFTLIETIGVIVVLSVLGSVVAMLIGQLGAAYFDSTVQGQMHIEASVSLDRLVREIRQIPKVEGSDTPSITTATNSALEWASIGSITASGTDLLLQTDGVHEDILVSKITFFTLDYLNNTGQSLLINGSVPENSISEIQRIRISLTLSHVGQTDTLHTLVFLRSTMSREDV